MRRHRLSFRWFGSLTNLSTRRPAEKASVEAAPEHDGSVCGAAVAWEGEGERSVDDMEPRLHSPGYTARSSDMYTHVGTVPREKHKKKKSCRSVKEKKKKEEEEQEEGEGLGAGQSQWRGGDHVRASPLLSALSSLSLSSMDPPQPSSTTARPLPATPTPSRASPLTSAPHSLPGDPGRQDLTNNHASESECSDMETVRPAAVASAPSSTQDVYVPMDPIMDVQSERQRGVTCSPETSVPQDEDRDNRSEDGTDGGRGGRGGGEYVKFSKEKFWLEPPSETLRKQLEAELKLSGADLKSHAWYHGGIPWEVSESLVLNHGDFLVRDSRSSRGDFVLTSRWEQRTLHFLIRRAAQPGDPYARGRVSLEGEAFESLPALVHFYAGGRAALTRWSGAQIHRPVNRTLPLSYLETAFCSGAGPATMPVCPGSPSSVHHQEAAPSRSQDGSTQSDTPQSTSPSSSRPASVTPPTTLSRCSDAAQAPPSPGGTLHRRHLDGQRDSAPSSDTEGSCYTELYPQSYVDRLRAEEGSPLVGGEDLYFSPVVETESCFRPGRYRSPLMATENKPLEVGILRRVKELLAEVEPRTAAKHITKADCMVARILEVTPELQRMMGVSSGMELLTLPHGQRLRLDLLERFQTMATMLAVDVLGCTGTTEERAALLHKIIQIAAELKSTMGNMFGFAAVMRALELPQVSRLEQTWTALRQRHTEGAILYEKTLRPFMKSLNEGRESCPLSSTTFPHVLPLLSLLESSAAVGEGAEPWETVEAGVDVVMFHLGAARTVAQLGGIYRGNAESRLQGFQERADVLELFLTDFQMRLLWGSRGAEENQALRFSKFDQVLTALSNKLEAPVRRHRAQI